MPFVGETIPLSFQLLDADTTKFCRAILTEPDGTALAASPVTMVHLGGGKYSADTVTMPNIDYVECRYEPFNDVGFTIVDPDHLVGTDVFRLEIPDTVIVDLLNQILNKLNGLSLPGAAINARLVQNKIKEIVQDTEAVKALVERTDVKATIDENKDLIAKLDQNKISPKVDC